MVGRGRGASVEPPSDGRAQAQRTLRPPGPPAAPERHPHAHPRSGPVGPGRPRARLLRSLLRVRLLPRLGRRPGGRGDGGRHPRSLRRRRLPRAAGAVRRGRRGDAAPDAAGGAAMGARCPLPGRRAHARPRRRIARTRPGRHAARRLPRPRVPAPPRRARGRVDLLGVEPPLLARGVAHPLRVPAHSGRPAPDRGVRGRRGGRDATGRGHHHRARPRLEAGPGERALRTHLGAPAGAAARAVGGSARARGLGAGRAGDPRGGPGARRVRALPRHVRGRGGRGAGSGAVRRGRAGARAPSGAASRARAGRARGRTESPRSPRRATAARRSPSRTRSTTGCRSSPS